MLFIHLEPSDYKAKLLVCL